FSDFMDRIAISIEQITILIRIGAFRFTGKNNYELLWKALFILQKPAKKNLQERLFTSSTKSFTFPEFHYSKLTKTYDELELLGFHLQHPFSVVSLKVCKSHLDSIQS